jgi:transposase InsO family protein
VAFFTNIIHRFGVLNSIITDNGTQFTGRKFLDFCEDHHIRVDWATVAHPMTNGQVERANGMILQGLKPRIYNDLHKFGRRWMKELPSAVWSLRTTPSRATGFTPFFLVYGAEAILPTDLEYGSPRTRAYDDQSNRTNREDSLDQLEEARDMALLHSAWYQRPCDATTPEGFGPETSRWATWCFDYDKTPEGDTSSRLPGKGHLSSPRF